MEKKDHPAYPMYEGDGIEPHRGLTKREYFAGLAMQGLVSRDDYPLDNKERQAIAELSVHMADELLKQLSE